MLSLGAFAFAAPGMLALLLVLPVIYWLLRMIPPLPKLVRFPAIRLLIGLEPTEQTPMKMPWWLLLLRLLLATALILAVARPLLNPQADLPGRGPLMLVIDDGWSSAPGWTTRIAHAERLIQRAERAQRPVVLTGTAPLPLDAPAARKRGAMRPDEARTILRAFRPKPWPTDRAAAVTAIDQMQVDPGAYVVWLSDGLEDEGTPRLTERLRKFDGLQVLLPDQATTPLLLLPPVAEGRDLKVQALRPAADGPRKIAVQASDEGGRIVARIDLDFAATATKGEGVLPTPPELRNRMARLDIETQGGAGSAVLLDERHRRRPVAILGERPTATGQPLLQEVYFLERALDPYVSLTIGDRETVLNRNTAVLLIPDGAAPSANDREEIAKWIERGGIAVRFAGPNLARATIRWCRRASAGRPRPGRRHELGLAQRAQRIPGQQPLPRHPDPQGRAHQPAGAGRADARPRREDLGAAGRRHAAGHRREARAGLPGADPHHRQHRLEQHGAERPVREHAAAPGDAVARRRRRRRQQGAEALAHPRRLRPPGRPARRRADPAGRRQRDVQAQADHAARPVRRRERPGRLQHRRPRRRAQADRAARRRLDRSPERRRRDRSLQVVPAGGPSAAAGRHLHLAVDARADGPRLPLRQRRAAAPAAILLAAAVFLPPPNAQAADQRPGPPPLSEEQALKGSLDIRLAYITTGDKEVDDLTKQGLEGLSEILRNRTSVEPADPVGLDLEKDEPRLYPLIYWAITPTQPALSPRAAAALDRYLRTGGILFIDTRDQHLSFDRPAGGNPDLKRLLGGVEIPPLVAMPPEHVLTKAFYLLSDMPGRWTGGKLWIEPGGGRVNDGVTTVIIGSNDYIGAWAADQRGRGIMPVSPGGETQREMSYRVGVNLVMHALTGNYKDDMVHMQDIMQRLRR